VPNIPSDAWQLAGATLDARGSNAPLTRLWPGRAEFIGILKREPPEAIDDIRKAGVGPVACSIR
jgi:hypothetical protein